MVQHLHVKSLLHCFICSYTVANCIVAKLTLKDRPIASACFESELYIICVKLENTMQVNSTLVISG